MKIAILPSWYPNNYQPHLGTFIKAQHLLLKQNGLDVHLLGAIPISIRYGFWPHAEDEAETKYLKFFSSIPGLRKWSALETRRKGLKLYQQYATIFGKPDILHVHSYLQGYFAIALHRKYQIPYVVTEHYTRLLNREQL